MLRHAALIQPLSLEEKVALCSGADFFHTKALPERGIPAIAMADGPHGLRKQQAAADHLGLNQSLPATCFPTASLTACSWDRALLRELGAALAEEALQEGVSIVLGPGANLKRNPLCGRNFEYFSEDPVLSGEMAAAWIQGLQSQGIGASLKHFAANNQETERMSSDSLVDERTLRELYLPAFEHAIRLGAPTTVMCAYNQLNGTHCSDHVDLLRHILRDEWGYTGVVVTDWGALNDRVQAFEAGLDLEMPGSRGHFDATVVAAIRSGALAEARLDESVDRLLDLIFAATEQRRPGYRYDVDAHHRLAQRIAAESAVLLKNEGAILPLKRGQTLAVIGALAQTPRYQGAGSSHINPTLLPNLLDGFAALGVEVAFHPGYLLSGADDPALLTEAVAGASQVDVAVVVAGLPESYESEGFDRDTLAMPASHVALIEQVAATNPNTVVVLVGGAPMEMPWLPRVRAVLHLYLAGQAGGPAAAELLLGRVNPSGKLAESYPLCYADVPSAGFYETGGKQAQYREGLYVGYRYYDTAGKDVLFPFGHGLSYTTFDYRDLECSPMPVKSPAEFTVSFVVENTGPVAGAEVVQVYVAAQDSPVYRPAKELKAFDKVFLQPGESRRLTLALDARAFAIYDTITHEWIVPGGSYRILVGASSRDIRLQAEVYVDGAPVGATPSSIAPWYTCPLGAVTQADFETLLGRTIEPVAIPKPGRYTVACTFQDMRASFIIRQVIKGIEGTVAKGLGDPSPDDPTYKTILSSSLNTPLKNLSLVSPESMPRHMTHGLVDLANGRWLRGIWTLLTKTVPER